MSTPPNWTGDPKIEPFVIKETDRHPILDLFLKYKDGTAYDLTGATTIDLVVSPCAGGRRLIDRLPGGNMVKQSPYTTGECWHSWGAGDLVAGEYLMEVIVDYGLSTQETFPKTGYWKLIVVPHI